MRNDKELGVKNGSLGIVEKVIGDILIIDVKGDKKSVNIKEYDAIGHGYAATIHKVQGITVDRSYLLASRMFNRHVSYVVLSRHRESVEVYWSKEQFKSFAQVCYLFSREQFKDVSLDYLHTATSARNIQINGKTLEQMRESTVKICNYGELSRELAKEFEFIEKEMNCKVNLRLQHNDHGKYAGEIEVGGRNFQVVEREGLKKTLYFVAGDKVGKDVAEGADVRIIRHINTEGKSEFKIAAEKSWMLKEIRETREANEINQASSFIHKAARRLRSYETVKLTSRITTYELYAALYNSIPRILPEFGFVKKGSYYISTTGHKVDGAVGSKHKVYIYENNPGVLIDYTRGNKSVWEYVQSFHMPCSSNYEVFQYLSSEAGLGRVFEEKYNLSRAFPKATPKTQVMANTDKALPAVGSKTWEKVYAFALDRIGVPNNQVSKYLENERGYTLEKIKSMGIGYIPSKKSLEAYLKLQGIDEIAEVKKSLHTVS